MCVSLSCEDRTHKTVYLNNPEREKIVVAPSAKDEAILYSQLFSAVEYIPLETMDESLLAEISRLDILDDGRILVFDGNKESVCLFGKDGEFLWKIGDRGNAYNEYSSIKDATYDRYNNQVIILDAVTNRLLFYSIEGQFFSSIELTCYPSSISVIDKDYLCLFLNYTDFSSKHSVSHNIRIINRKGDLCSELLEYSNNIRNFHPAYEKVFCQSEHTLYLNPPFSSVIYKVSADSLSPVFCFDFGEKSISEETFMDADVSFSESISIMQRGIFIYSFLKTPSYLFLKLSNCGSIYLCVMNTKNPHSKLVSAHVKNDIYGYVSSSFPVAAKGNKCYHIIESTVFERYRETIEKNGGVCYNVVEGKIVKTVPKQAEMKLLNLIHDGDNPVIQVCTLKE